MNPAGCAADRPPPHELRIALGIDPASLSPLLAFAQNQIATDLLFCQTLVGLDAHDRVIPVLVLRVPSRENGDISPDGRRITYHLRTDARFADGVPVTSADVAFTYRAIFDPRNNAASVDAYRRIASLTTPDPHTVVIVLRRPWNAACGSRLSCCPGCLTGPGGSLRRIPSCCAWWLWPANRAKPGLFRRCRIR